MAKFEIKVNSINTNTVDDGEVKVATGTIDGREFTARSEKQDGDGRDLFKVGGSLEENSEFTRGERIAIARACRKGVAPDEPTSEVLEELETNSPTEGSAGGLEVGV